MYLEVYVYENPTCFSRWSVRELKYKTISDDSPFYDGFTIEKTVGYLESGIPIILFWIAWIILIVIAVFGFYYLDNKWLE